MNRQSGHYIYPLERLTTVNSPENRAAPPPFRNLTPAYLLINSTGLWGGQVISQTVCRSVAYAVAYPSCGPVWDSYSMLFDVSRVFPYRWSA